jgi:hypothetical protein
MSTEVDAPGLLASGEDVRGAADSYNAAAFDCDGFGLGEAGIDGHHRPVVQDQVG